MNIFKTKNVCFFLISDLLSGFAIGMSTIGFSWFVMEQTKSSLQVGYLTTLNVMSSFIVSIFAGTITDKYDRKKIMLWCYLIAAIFLTIALMFLVIFDFGVIIIYFCSIINGAVWSVYLSSSKSLLQEILPKSSFAQGNSFIEISLQFGTLSAGLISGIVFMLSGIKLLLLLNIVLFFCCSFFIGQIKHTSTIISQNSKTSILRSFVDGARYLFTRKNVLLIGLVSIIPLTVTTFFNVVLPGYVYNILNGDSLTYGIGDMLYGIGAMSSGFLISCFCNKYIHRNRVSISFFAAILAFVPLLLNHNTYLFFICCFIFGISNVFIKIIANTQLMTVIPSEYMGRSIGTLIGISLLIQAIGAALLGKLVDVYGGNIGFISIIIVLIIGVVVYTSSSLEAKKD